MEDDLYRLQFCELNHLLSVRNLRHFFGMDRQESATTGLACRREWR